MILEEIKKILQWKCLLVLGAFALIYFLLFLKPFVQIHEGSYHQQADVTQSMIKKHGTLSTTDAFELLKADYPKYEPDILDKIIANSPKFEAFGFENYKDFSEGFMELTDAEAIMLWNILTDGGADRNVIMAGDEKNIELWTWDELMLTYQTEILQKPAGGTSYYEKLDNAQKIRVAERNKEEIYGIMPQRVLRNNFEVMQFMSAFMLLSVIFVIVPYMVRDNRSNMVSLQYASKKGRRFHLYKFSAAMISSGIVLAAELAIFVVISFINGVFPFWNCPVSSFFSGFISWFKLTFGQLIMLGLGITILLSLGMVMIVFGITRYCSNYITAIAWQLPLAVFAGVFGGIVMYSFTEITMWKYLAIWVCVAGFALGLIFMIGQYVWEKRRNA